MPANGLTNKLGSMEKMTGLVISCLFLIGTPGFSQRDSVLQAEIDAQVWRPFIQSFSTFDAAAFNTLHTADILRGGPWGLVEGDTYRQNTSESFAKNNAAGVRRKIAFTFEQRVQRETVAYEVGYYRVVSETDSGEPHTSYGQFHVVLRKENGSWKIAQDWDAGTLNGEKITETHFMKHAGNGIYE